MFTQTSLNVPRGNIHKHIFTLAVLLYIQKIIHSTLMQKSSYFVSWSSLSFFQASGCFCLLTRLSRLRLTTSPPILPPSSAQSLHSPPLILLSAASVFTILRFIPGRRRLIQNLSRSLPLWSVLCNKKSDLSRLW